MPEICLRITEVLISGGKRSFRAGSDDSKTLVVNLLSREGIVGCLTLQFDDSGKPFIKLQREQGFDFQVCSFAQMKLQSYVIMPTVIFKISILTRIVLDNLQNLILKISHIRPPRLR